MHTSIISIIWNRYACVVGTTCADAVDEHASTVLHKHKTRKNLNSNVFKKCPDRRSYFIKRNRRIKPLFRLK